MEVTSYILQYYRLSMLFFCCLLMILEYTQFATGIDLQDFTVCKDRYASMMVQETWTIQIIFYCYFYCGRNSWCRALTTKPVTGGFECTFHAGIFDVTCNSFPVLDNLGYRLLLKNEAYIPSNDNGCLNGGTFNSGCDCQGGFTGTNCERYVYDCKEAKNTNVYLNPATFTGVLTKPPTSQQAFVSFCSGVGQTVFVARNPRVFDLQFNRTWDEYKYGFGIHINLWMGLEWIQKLSAHYNGAYGIQMYCGNLDTNDGFSVMYDSLTLDDESLLYKAIVAAVAPADVSNDLLGTSNGRPFCTYDSPCNGLPNSTMGGWWYGSSLERNALTHPSANLYCRRNNIDFEAHSVSIAYV